MRDQFVWGLKNERIKKRLLGEHDLSYKKAVESAQPMEMATKDVAEMGSSSKNLQARLTSWENGGRVLQGVIRTPSVFAAEGQITR